MSFHLQDVGLVHANGHEALRSLSLAARHGERLAVIGPSGAGKTTLLRLLGASLRPTSGQVAVLEQSPWTMNASALRRLRSTIGMVHQSPPLPARQRVVTAVQAGRLGQWSLGRTLLALAHPLDARGAHEALSRLDLGERLFERCDRLSGGQLQRVGIARVLYQQPALILADEPVSALDPALADATLGVLVEQSIATKATLVASLHAVDLALKWFPRIVGLRDGQVAFDRPAADVSREMLQRLYATEGGGLPLQLPLSATKPLEDAPLGAAAATATTGTRAPHPLGRPPC